MLALGLVQWFAVLLAYGIVAMIGSFLPRKKLHLKACHRDRWKLSQFEIRMGCAKPHDHPLRSQQNPAEKRC